MGNRKYHRNNLYGKSSNRKTKKLLKRYLTEVTGLKPNKLHIIYAFWNPFEPDAYISKYNRGKRIPINSIEFAFEKTHVRYVANTQNLVRIQQILNP